MSEELVSITLKMESFDGKLFIDTGKRALDDILRHMVAYVGKTARNSIKQGGAVSQPGNPPVSHGGRNFLRNLMHFAKLEGEGWIVGPEFVPSAAFGLFSITSAIPGLLEHGGTVRKMFKVLRYRPRPYMLPAADKTFANISKFFE